VGAHGRECDQGLPLVLALDSGSKHAYAGSTRHGSLTGNSDSYSGDADGNPRDTDSYPGYTYRGPGDADRGPGDADHGPGYTDAHPRDADRGPGDTDRYPGGTDSYPGDTYGYSGYAGSNVNALVLLEEDLSSALHSSSDEGSRCPVAGITGNAAPIDAT
jgi:hypothetical protein